MSVGGGFVVNFGNGVEHLVTEWILSFKRIEADDFAKMSINWVIIWITQHYFHYSTTLLLSHSFDQHFLNLNCSSIFSIEIMPFGFVQKYNYDFVCPES